MGTEDTDQVSEDPGAPPCPSDVGDGSPPWPDVAAAWMASRTSSRRAEVVGSWCYQVYHGRTFPGGLAPPFPSVLPPFPLLVTVAYYQVLH